MHNFRIVQQLYADYGHHTFDNDKFMVNFNQIRYNLHMIGITAASSRSKKLKKNFNLSIILFTSVIYFVKKSDKHFYSSLQVPYLKSVPVNIISK